MVNLLALVAPSQAPALLRILLGTTSASSSSSGGGGGGGGGSGQRSRAQLFKTEMMTHAAIQAGTCGPLVIPRCQAYPGYSMLPYPDAPLLLVLSKAALDHGSTVSFDQIDQIITAFAYDEETATAQWVMTKATMNAHIHACTAGHMSRCACSPQKQCSSAAMAAVAAAAAIAHS